MPTLLHAAVSGHTRLKRMPSWPLKPATSLIGSIAPAAMSNPSLCQIPSMDGNLKPISHHWQVILEKVTTLSEVETFTFLGH